MNVLKNVKGSFIKSKTVPSANKCMNCGNIITEPLPGPDGRRFCSDNCKKEYFG
jgi:predicted nucleic acid-binding Zn ribbon protein